MSNATKYQIRKTSDGADIYNSETGEWLDCIRHDDVGPLAHWSSIQARHGEAPACSLTYAEIMDIASMPAPMAQPDPTDIFA